MYPVWKNLATLTVALIDWPERISMEFNQPFHFKMIWITKSLERSVNKFNTTVDHLNGQNVFTGDTVTSTTKN